ncbi:MAG: hypothetical protein KJ808_05795 [Acidobacteria bacterium]|nr:hypothetical protein [Acidobacteriota bacterium]MBU4307449.1 hypothetical protein [Acidobacteriota bacterium]MCG2812118.1 hypothetical protein [Candidatus Aminicenantes bacterium]
MRLRRLAMVLLALPLLAGNWACSKSTTTPPVEKVENIQNFTATNSENGSTVAGTHQYSTNGASGALGSLVSAGFTNQNAPVNCNITVTGNGIFARTYTGTSIYGTQTRSDVMSGNGRVDVNNWVSQIGADNTTWGYSSMVIEFYDNDIPRAFKNAVVAAFKEYASSENKLLKAENITWVDAGAWPGSYTAKKGVIQIKTSPQASGMSNHSDQFDGITCAGNLAPNPDFDSLVYAMIPGERNDLLQGPSNVDGDSVKLSTLIHGANMHAEGRKNYRLVLENGAPKEYQNGFSGNTSQSATVYSSLQSAPGTTSLFGSDDGTPDDEKMVVGRRYGETPRMDDKVKEKHAKNR